MNVSVDNISSSTCEESRFVGRSTVDFDTEAILRYLLVGYLILLFPFSVCLNGFLIILMATIKSLHQTVYFLALQVVVVDFVLSIFVIPITIANAIAGKWIFGPTFCSLSILVIHFIRMTRYWLMFVFVSDRFSSVFFPFSYLKYQKRFVVILSIMAWTLSLSFAILPVALDCEVFSRIAFYCTGGNGCTNTNACQSTRLITVTLTNIMGSFVPLVLYVILFIKAKMLQKSMIKLNRNSDDSNRRNNATLFFLFLALFGVNIFPFFFFIVGNSILSTLSIPPPSQYVIATIIFRSLYNILPLIDAIAIIRNSDFRKAIRSFKSKLLG